MEAQPNGSVSGYQLLEAKLTEKLKGVVLPERSMFQEQCIYIVREGVRQVNPKAYTPQVVSIGPFHNPWRSGKENNMLKSMEELKLKYLMGFLNRTELCVADILLKLEKLFKLSEWENRIRRCYAGPINYDNNNDDFLQMIITDACFIIEHFLRYYRLSEWQEKDPLLSKPSLVSDIERDLILLENQLPFFVLKDIYDLAIGINPEFPSFVHITFCYFQPFYLTNINPEGERPKHFTDFLRTFLLPSSSDLGQGKIESETKQVYSASQLKEAGLVFKKSESTCLLDLEFEKGVFTMPCFHVDDSTETYLRNILAFEEYHLPYSAYVTQYFRFLDLLINTGKDVSILIDKRVIVNWIGDANSVATMVHNLCKNIWQPGFHSKYLSLCKSLNGFYENPRNKLYKGIFNTPVKRASTITATLALLLTLIQTIFSICSHLKEYKIM